MLRGYSLLQVLLHGNYLNTVIVYCIWWCTWYNDNISWLYIVMSIDNPDFKSSSPDIYSLLKENARKNRKRMTEAETVMWERLRQMPRPYSFRRQHIIGDYIVDFVCLSKKTCCRSGWWIPLYWRTDDTWQYPNWFSKQNGIQCHSICKRTGYKWHKWCSSSNRGAYIWWIKNNNKKLTSIYLVAWKCSMPFALNRSC